MNFKLYFMTALLGLCLISAGANAATWFQITPTGPGTLHLNNADYSYSPYTTPPVESIWGYNGNITPQNQANILTHITSVYGTAPIFKDKADIGNGTFNTPNAFNYLAIHVGQGELLFRFFGTISQFTISKTGGTAGGLSNYRTYLGDIITNPNPPNPVPVPAAVWLFGSALAGLVGTARRKSKTAIPA